MDVQCTRVEPDFGGGLADIYIDLDLASKRLLVGYDSQIDAVAQRMDGFGQTKGGVSAPRATVYTQTIANQISARMGMDYT